MLRANWKYPFVVFHRDDDGVRIATTYPAVDVQEEEARLLGRWLEFVQAETDGASG